MNTTNLNSALSLYSPTPIATTTQTTTNMSDSPLPSRIDVHSHFLPPFYRDALAQNGHTHPDGMPAIPEWSLEAHLEMMSVANVTKSILSLSSPGTHLNISDPSLMINLTRQCNAYAASLKKQHPEKFGYWASLPLPDVDAALGEIDKATEEGADGFALMTNYHGTYLGDSKFDRIFTKLNDLAATVFIHPTAPCMHLPTGSQTEAIKACPLETQYPIPIFEFFFDSSRAAINLFSSGTVDRCPNMHFILTHAAGCLPPLLTRFI
jgi:predicted TIM-barrel fold metal-dependent hydrolase